MPDTQYRVGTHSGVNIWRTRADGDRQVAMARTDHEADQLVRLANAGLALADTDPRAVYPVSGTDRTTSLCTLCGAIEGEGGVHLAECPWRMAREALGLPAGWPVADADPDDWGYTYEDQRAAMAGATPNPPVADNEAPEGDVWRCPRCGSPRWVGASLTGPPPHGKAIRQCVPCGHYSDDPVGATRAEDAEPFKESE
jgi:hypothetical protein